MAAQQQATPRSGRGQNEPSWPRDALPRGTQLNGYTVQAVIGRGGFGITYRATDGIDQVFALKECFPKQFAVREGSEVLPSDEDSTEPFEDCLKRFGQEARALRQLANLGAAGDGVVKVVTFFQANGSAYVVMEFLAGDSLDRAIKAAPGGMDRAQVAAILPRMLHAVGCVHAAGLLHRDIKPANIILRPDGSPVLIDFGAARTAGHGRTVTFTQIFSEGYAPIEQVSGTKQGPFSDIYAVGATFYKAIGGVPVDAFTRHQALLRGKQDPQPAARELGSRRYDPRLLSAIDAAMVVAPGERPQSVDELLRLLLDEADLPTVEIPRAAPDPVHPSVKPQAAEAVPPAPAAGPRRGLLTLAAACLLIAALGGAAAFMLSSRRADAVADAPAAAVTPPASLVAAGHDAVAQPPAPEATPTPAEKSRLARDTVAANRASAASASALATVDRAKSALAEYGLDSTGVFAEVDGLLAQGDKDSAGQQYDQAIAVYAEAAARVAPEAGAFLRDAVARLAHDSRKAMNAGDLTGAQTALASAKTLRQAMQAGGFLAWLALPTDPADERARLEADSASYASLAKRRMQAGDLAGAQAALTQAKELRRRLDEGK